MKQSKDPRKWETRLVRGKFHERSFDIEFWQAQGDAAIFEAAWEIVVLAFEQQGRKPIFDKTVTKLTHLRTTKEDEKSDKK